MTETLSKGQESARVLRRASILRQLDGGQRVAQVAVNAGVAPKTVRAIARRYEEEGAGLGFVRKAASGPGAGTERGAETADRGHGLRPAAARQGAVERTAHCRGSGETEAGAAGEPGNHPYSAAEP